MFSKANDAASLSASNSSVDWECDAESRSWSSSASWSDDVEGEATGHLWQQLEDIECVLYGEASPRTLPFPLRQEVAQWRATFPHLRVCGTKPPMGPPPSEEEEGEEEVYASHGEVTEEDEIQSKARQTELREQLKHKVMQKLFNKVRSEMPSFQSKNVKDNSVPSVSAFHQREPLLAQRQSARKDSVKDFSRKQSVPHETKLGSILRVSPLPRRAIPPRANAPPRSSVVLPPIEPLKGSTTVVPLSVMGRQTRLVQPKTKVTR